MNIIYTKEAEKFLDTQTEKQTFGIRKAISSLPGGDIKRLRGIENAYRLRVGNVRVLFEKNVEAIHVIKIDNRGDVYK